MDRIENESSGLFCPGTADVFVRRKAFQDLETTGEAVRGDESEFRGPIDGDEQVELSLCCAQLGDVDVEVTDRVGFEFSLGGTLILDLRQARDAVPLQAAMQR